MLKPSVGGQESIRRVSADVGALSLLVLGGIAGGLLLGMSFGLASVASAAAGESLRIGGMVAATAFAAVAAVSTHAFALLPNRVCQVPATSTAAGRARAAWAWGLELGLGFRTFIVTPLWWLMAAYAIFALPPAGALALGAVYGATRLLAIAGASVVHGFRGNDDRVVTHGMVHQLRMLAMVACVAAGSVGVLCIARA